jgi:hypothetical protein
MLRRKSFQRVGFCVLLGIGALLAGAKAPERRLQPEPGVTGVDWKGSQFIRSDAAGRVFLFRGDEPAVYPITKTGEIGKPESLQTANESLGHVLDVALSPGGDRWLVRGEGRVRLFVEGKEKTLPPMDWLPWSIGFVRDTPVVAVVPRPLPAGVLHLDDLGNVPWLVTLDNDRWSTLARLSDLSAETAWKERSRFNQWVTEYAVFLAADREGKLWAANQYAYRVRRLSGAGRNLLDIASTQEEEAPPKAPPSAAVVAATRKAETEGAKFTPFTERPVIADLVEGRDHAIYLLVHAPGEGTLALDRYDSVRGVVERAPLEMHGTGRFTLAAGKDGLYLAPYNAPEGVRKLSWESLQEAAWKEIDSIKVQGGK